MQWLQMNPPKECGLISLLNSYLAFSFFHFSETTLIEIRCMLMELQVFSKRHCNLSVLEYPASIQRCIVRNIMHCVLLMSL